MSHADNLARVRDNIAEYVYTFCRLRIGRVFTAAQLRDHVTHFCPGIAPDSPGRILRDLRKSGRVQYELVSRAQSLYRVVGVRG